MRTKLSRQEKVVNVKNPTDASHYTHKKRQIANQVFLDDGTGKGSLVISTDRPTNAHAATSYPKASGRPADASSYTAYRGHIGIDNDSAYTSGGKRTLPCTAITPASTWNYPSASSVTKVKASCPAERGDEISSQKFVDKTVRLSAMHPQTLDGTRECELSVPNHEHSPGLPVCDQKVAVGKPFFMRSPPNPQAPNTSDNKVGAYFNPRSGYVENKHGYVKPSGPTPKAPGGQGQEPAHLKINRPTLFPVKI